MLLPTKIAILFSLARKWMLLILLLTLFICFFYFHLQDYLHLQTIKTYQAVVETWTQDHYKTATALFLLIYTLMIACAIPGGTVLTLLGGFLFGMIAFVYVLLGTVTGGLILYFAVRSAIGGHIAAHTTSWVKKLEGGFKKNAFNYLLMLRLVPVFPCWVSNITAGALNVPLGVFISATLLGVAPATLIYVMVGRGLDKLLALEPSSGLSIFLAPSILLPLIGLAMLSLFPVVYKSLKKR